MRPTKVRYRVLALTLVLAFITYMDRVCISISSKHVAAELKLSDVQMGYVFSAFTVAYGLFEIPTGWWGDKIGTRAVLTRIVAWWSAFTMFTSLAWNYSSLLVIRFLFGAGEAGAFPNAARTFSRWFPMSERGRAQGIFFTGAHFGAAVTPVVVQWMLTFMHWRSVFLAAGAIGFLWCVVWYMWFRNEPHEHPAVNEAERHLIESGRAKEMSHSLGGVPWGRIVSSPDVLLLCFSYLTQTYAFYFFITWLPQYLERARGFSKMSLGIFAGLPMLFCMLGDVTGGVTTDWMARRHGLRWGRALAGFVSLAMAGVFMLAGAAATDNVLAAVLLSIGAGWSTFCLGPAWSACMDLGGRNAGVLSACMNTSGQVGGALSPIVLAYIVQHYSNWSLPLYMTGVFLLLGAISFLFVDSNRRVA